MDNRPAHPTRPEPLAQPVSQRRPRSTLGRLLRAPLVVERQHIIIRLRSQGLGVRGGHERVPYVQSAVQLRTAGAAGHAG